MRQWIAGLALLSSLFFAVEERGFAQGSANEVLVSKARALEGRGRPDLAAQTWKQVLLADPNHQEALASLARFAKQSGKADEAKAYLSRLRKLNSSHPALEQVQAMPVLVQQQARLNEAARLVANQQFDQAMQIYRQVFGDEPPPGGMAIAYYETLAAVPGGWESATAGLRKLMDAYPGVADYKLSLGRLWTYRPSTRLAGMKLLEGFEGGKEAMNRARQAWRQALVWEGSNPQVAPSLRAYLARYPDPELSRLLEALPAPQHSAGPAGPVRNQAETAGYLELKANRISQAEIQFEAALKENARSVGALSGLGFVRMKQENFASAAALFELAAKEAPKDKDIADSLETARFWAVMKDAADRFGDEHLQEAASRYRRAVAMRPASPEAMQGLAGTLMKMNDAENAAPLFEKLTELQPQNDDAWYQLLNARYHATGPDSVIAASGHVPASVRVALARNVNFLAMMSAAHADAGKTEESRRYLLQAVELANVKGLILPVGLQLQIAGLYLRHGYHLEATTVFQEAVDKNPNNVEAWEGLLTSLIQTHQEGRASRALERMPAKVYQAATSRPNSLRSLAAIASSLGQWEDAERYLEKSIRLDTKVEDASNISARLQLAHLWLAQGRNKQAESMLRSMTASYPENPDAWKALISALHQQNRDDLAIKEDSQIPQSVHTKLADDADYVSLFGAALNTLGRYDEALRFVRRATALMKQQNRQIPSDLQIQLGWLLLNTRGDERELYALLNEIGNRNDLSQRQQDSVSEIWSTWTLRRANLASQSGEYERAAGILEAATRMLPKDMALRSALAGVYLQAGQPAKALQIYRSWGMAGGSASDFAGAIGAALGTNAIELANTWLRASLNRWPNNPDLLNLAGKAAAAKGDYKAAKAYWKAALAAAPVPAEVPPGRGLPPAIQPTERRPAREVIGELLLGSGPAPAPPQNREQAPAALAPEAPPRSQPKVNSISQAREDWASPRIPVTPASWTQSGQRSNGSVRFEVPVLPEADPIQPASEAPVNSGPGPYPRDEREILPPVPAAPLSSAASSAALPFSEAIRPATGPAESHDMRSEIQDRLKSIESRNSSYLGSGGTIRGRSGEMGFDRMVLEEANLEASHVLGGVRVSIIAHPTYIDSGTPDGQSDKRFGLAPKGSVFEAQSAGGIGGEVQVSTETFGLRAGSTPRDFLVSNFIGGIRFRPGNGPITLLAERDVVRDSMLSFAGVRDPITNQVWGGVVANSFSAQGNWGGSASGFYTSFGYQNITGRHVQTNSRVDGNAGMYWRVFENDNGRLTAGFNLSGMHYEKNLRYFTMGHGGYFSPQQYVLANVPVQWRGVYNRRIQYLVNASMGAQHFQEDSSPYFPTLPALQGKNGPYYPKQAATGANYSVDVQMAIQLTPVWYLGTFANVNNTRNYNSAAAGVSVRYSTRPRAINQEFDVPSIPDWRGIEPFRLR